VKTNRRRFLQATAATATAGVLPAEVRSNSDGANLDGFQIAKRHAMVRDLPTPDFFEGMLLGNGDIGLCITVRPDALGLHLGKEDSWDIRVSEDHYQHVLPFDELLKLWQRASEEAKRLGKPDMIDLEYQIDVFRDYTTKVDSSYRKSWPRPWPCGIVWIHWDSRQVRVRRQTLDPSNGMYTLELEHDDLRGHRQKVTMWCFVNWHSGHVLVWSDAPAPIVSISYLPNIDAQAQLPPPELDGTMGSITSFPVPRRKIGAARWTSGSTKTASWIWRCRNSFLTRCWRHQEFSSVMKASAPSGPRSARTWRLIRKLRGLTARCGSTC
jgi:hypothetical protein